MAASPESAPAAAPPAVELRGISKSFGAVRANRDHKRLLDAFSPDVVGFDHAVAQIVLVAPFAVPLTRLARGWQRPATDRHFGAGPTQWQMPRRIGAEQRVCRSVAAAVVRIEICDRVACAVPGLPEVGAVRLPEAHHRED